MIERPIGALDKISRSYTRWRHSDTDARCHTQPYQVRFVALIRLHSLPNPFCDRSCTLRCASGHHHRELLAAESCAHVEDAYRSPENLRDVANDHVARNMAEAIIDALEAVEIDHQQTDRRQLANRSMEFFFQSRLEVSAVEETAHGIDHCGLCIGLRFAQHAFTSERECNWCHQHTDRSGV